MKFLITRCTTYDMAGVAMINGAVKGLKQVYNNAEVRALVFPQNSSPSSPIGQFYDPEEREEAFAWTDCCIDLGGLCKGYDPYRLEYIKACQKKDIPYIYMAVSFEHPDPEIVRGIPATARGIHSAEEYKKSVGNGKLPPVVPDISFLIEPEKLAGGDYITFTTHKGKPWAEFMEVRNRGVLLGVNMMQVIFKPQNNVIWEPILNVTNFHGTPEQLYGAIGSSKYLYTCRYHAGVAAIMGKVNYLTPLGMPNKEKYEDLERWKGMNLGAIRSHAKYSCEFVKEILHG
jgi:Polysaccharide pyruvyl transferase